ncbi:MAG TPA: hypothetical protein VEU33_21795 [Archangium sp.]|nr:hypothetical protein [Archangium sp.]
MPRVSSSRWIGIRLASAPTRFPLAFLSLLSVVLLCPLACASNSPPQAYAATREALADLDEFGALLTYRSGTYELGTFYKLDENNQPQPVSVGGQSAASR